MSETTHPIFERLQMTLLSSSDFDQNIMTPETELKCVFFWGHDCPNCDVAKKSLFNNIDQVTTRSLQWYHVNVYNDFDLGTRFGLYGVPVFIFFKAGKSLGRITTFPGIEPFLEAVDRLYLAFP